MPSVLKDIEMATNPVAWEKKTENELWSTKNWRFYIMMPFCLALHGQSQSRWQTAVQHWRWHSLVVGHQFQNKGCQKRYQKSFKGSPFCSRWIWWQSYGKVSKVRVLGGPMRTLRSSSIAIQHLSGDIVVGERVQNLIGNGFSDVNFEGQKCVTKTLTIFAFMLPSRACDWDFCILFAGSLCSRLSSLTANPTLGSQADTSKVSLDAVAFPAGGENKGLEPFGYVHTWVHKPTICLAERLWLWLELWLD